MYTEPDDGDDDVCSTTVQWICRMNLFDMFDSKNVALFGKKAKPLGFGSAALSVCTPVE